MYRSCPADKMHSGKRTPGFRVRVLFFPMAACRRWRRRAHSESRQGPCWMWKCNDNNLLPHRSWVLVSSLQLMYV